MTVERRQDFLLVALVASVAVHALLMAFMRPQVMTHVTGDWSKRRRAHGPVRISEAPERAKPVAMDAVRDVAPVRDSPVAGAESLMPAGASVEAPAPAPDAASAAPPPAMPVSAGVAALEAAPTLSEVIHLDADASGFTTRVFSDRMERSVPSAPFTSAPAPEAARVAAEAPAPAPPQIDAAGREPDAPAEPSGPSASEPVPRVPAYVPSGEVLSHVDEKVVESEKAAVRGLLDVRDAGELSEMVDVSGASASSGGWTYFRVTVSPRAALAPVPKDVVVLLDASGSIGDDRLRSCRSAARRILRSCTNTGDRFNLVAFRDRFTYAFRSWQDCDKASFAKADRWLDSLASHGRTDVFSVIRSVLTLPRSPERPLVALVVTDGDANAGVRETAQILSKFTELNDGLVSVYMYGVRESANRELIDVLTRGNRGEGFIYGGSRWKAGSQIDALGERFRDPVLSDLRVVFPTGSRAEAYPRLLRNLYRGGTVELVGRVPDGVREVSFSLRGLNGAKSYEGFFRVDLAKAGFDGNLPSAWAEELSIDEKLR